jgi:hypothetical protein
MLKINGAQVLLAVIAATALWYACRWWLLEHGRGQPAPLRPADLAIGFGINFFDTLGIGSFAPTTAIFKLLHGGWLAFAVGVNFVLGAPMMVGVAALTET